MRVPIGAHASRLFVVSSTLLTVCFIVLAASGCGKPPNTAVPLVVALFDVSSPELPAATRQQYFEDFKRGVIQPLQDGAARTGETVLADLTGQATFGYTDWPVRVTFPVFDRATASLDAYHKTVQALAETLTAQAEQVVVNAPAPPPADLMDAIKATERAFTSEEGLAAPNRTLLIFSDMLVQSTRHDFTTDRLTVTGIRTLIQDERNAERLPSLKGVRVWVAGAGASPKSGISTSKAKQLHAFWTEYFRACGTDLPEKCYTERLAKCSLLAAK
jgi:hypothetical protein